MEIGNKAVNFCLPDNTGAEHCLENYKGKWIILYFYPKDNTSGCTKEAVDFTEKKQEFENRNAVIIGVSPDSQQSHSKFIEKHNLSILLLSDLEKNVMREYGAWGMKKNYGKEYEGVIRSTFIISPDFEIVYKWHNVKVQQKRKAGIVKHVDIVLKKLDELL
jgi:peroxiredoxin Q/BCP